MGPVRWIPEIESQKHVAKMLFLSYTKLWLQDGLPACNTRSVSSVRSEKYLTRKEIEISKKFQEGEDFGKRTLGNVRQENELVLVHNQLPYGTLVSRFYVRYQYLTNSRPQHSWSPPRSISIQCLENTIFTINFLQVSSLSTIEISRTIFNLLKDIWKT